MKKIILTSFTALLTILTVNATKWNVNVQNYSFSPATLNVTVGDTVVWTWVSGSHTTTSTAVPAGAATWNKSITSSSTTFQYKVTVAGDYSYWCVPHKPEMAGTIKATAVTPVQLISFNVSSSTAAKALLTWSTATEQNTDYFSVRKSTDGKTFTEVAKVKAVGNSVAVQKYSYTDNAIGNSDRYVYYYLAIVDKDNSTQLSDIKMFKNTNAVTKLIRSISPNPVSKPGHLMLQFYADKEGVMDAAVFSAEGKLAMRTQLNADAGLNNGHIHLGELQPGIYQIVFTMDGVKETYKVVVQ